MAKRFVFLLILVFAAVACEPQAGMQGERRYETRDYVDALRGKGITQIRLDKNRKLSDRFKAEVSEVYIGNLQLIVVNAPPGKETGMYAQYFKANEARGDHFRHKGNLLLVAPASAQPEVIDAFEGL